MRVPCVQQIECLSTALLNEQEASAWAIRMQGEHIARIEAELASEIDLRARAESRLAAVHDVVDRLMGRDSSPAPVSHPSSLHVIHGGSGCTAPAFVTYPAPDAVLPATHR